MEPRSRARARAAEANTDMKTGTDGRSCRPCHLGRVVRARLPGLLVAVRRLYLRWCSRGRRLRVGWRGLADTTLQGACALKTGICDWSCRHGRGVRAGLPGGIGLGRPVRRRWLARVRRQLPPNTCLPVDCARKSGTANRIVQRHVYTCLLTGHQQVGRCAFSRCVRAFPRVVDRRDCCDGHRLQRSQHGQCLAGCIEGTLMINHLPRSDMGSHVRTTR